MGLMQSKNKVGVLSEEEEEAYGKMGEEMKKEMVDDIICTKPQPWLMFHSEPTNPSPCHITCPLVSIMEKKGAVAFSIEYKSTVPKLPPSNVARNQGPKEKGYCKWKEERDKLLAKKHEQAKIRKENFIHQRITSARRPKTVGNRATYDNEVTSSEG